MPILVKSSVTLGILPTIDGVLSWLPMDAVASAIVDVAINDAELPLALNLVHPRPIEWMALIMDIQASVTEVLGRDLELVSLADWFSAIEVHASKATADTFAAVPAVKLLDFFREITRANDTIVDSDKKVEIGGVATFSTEKMLQMSDVMSHLPQIGREDVRRWVQYWREVDFLV